MTTSTSKAKLSQFLDSLDEELDWKFDLEEFDDRFRLQKYVILAEEFGFNHGYNYGIHLRGPYSPSLAEDYYDDLPTVEERLDGFNSDEFADLVRGKSNQWLEIAGTVRAFYTKCPAFQDDPIEWAIQQTIEEKNQDEQFVREVVEELIETSVLSRK